MTWRQPRWCTKPILCMWQLSSFPRQTISLFQQFCPRANHVSENTLYEQHTTEHGITLITKIDKMFSWINLSVWINARNIKLLFFLVWIKVSGYPKWTTPGYNKSKSKRIYILIVKLNKFFSSFSSRCFLKETENIF